jgi:hypothetical protein
MSFGMMDIKGSTKGKRKGKTMLSVMEHSGHFYAQVYP